MVTGVLFFLLFISEKDGTGEEGEDWCDYTDVSKN